MIGWTDMPGVGDELHHYGWNACSRALKHVGHNTDGLQRRYLLAPESSFPTARNSRALRVHQIRLQGGDASTDSYCYR